MAQVQTFPFSSLVSPIDNRPSRLTAVGELSNISSLSSMPDQRSKTNVFNGQLYQESLLTPKNPYFGPNIFIGLPITSSVAIIGNRLDLDVHVTGYPLDEFTYTWYRNGSVFTGDTYRTIANNPTGSILTINSVSSSESSTTYTLRVSSPYNDPSPATGSYSETTTSVYVDVNLFHPAVLFTVVGAIQ